MNGNNLYTFWVTIKALILGWIRQKQDTITGGASTITGDNLDKNRALISNGNGKVAVSGVTSTELGYLSGVTSNIQTQLGDKVSTTDFDDFTDWAEPEIKKKQDKIKFGSADSGAVTTISAGTNITISISEGTATINNTYSYTLLAATDDALGGIKTGFSDNDSTQDAVIRRAVRLQSQKAYVNIPYATDSVKGVAAFGNTMSVSGGVANVDTGSSALRNGLLMTTEEPGLVFLTSSEAAASASQYVGYSATYLNTQFSTVNTALGQKAPLASPNFTGTPTISSKAIATQEYVDSAITGAETFKGTLASEADLKAYGNFKGGWYWRVALPSGTSTATIAGQTVESGDMVYCTVTHNHTAGAAITNDNFNVVNTNIVFLTDTEIAEIVNAAS